MTTRTVRGLGAAALLAASLGLSGCAVFSPVQTTIDYQPADGVKVGLGAVKIDNLLVVAPALGGPGTLSASVVNPTGQAVAIAFTDSGSGSSARFEVPAYTTDQMSGDGNLVELDKVSAAPGGIITVDVTSPIAGTTEVDVPVLDSQSYYRTLQPTSAPTPTASVPSPTAIVPSPTGSATPAAG